MRLASGRFAIGLILASTLAGACLSEQDKGEQSVLPEAQPQAAAAGQSAGDVIFAVRNQLERGFGRTNPLIRQRTASAGIEPFNSIGVQTPKAVEFLGTSGDVRDAAARIELPAQANGMFRLQDISSGVTIDVGLEGATAAAREEADGYVVYRAGYLQGAHIVQRATSFGTEDYVYFPEKVPEKSELRYRVKLGDGVAGLRLIQQTIEMLGADGAPRLRMNKPYAVDGDGRRLALDVAIDDCAYDSSLRLPWGRTPVNPGARECTVRLTWPSDAKAPLVVDPEWTLTADMHEIRMNATSLAVQILGKSRVLVVGGDSASGAMGTSQTTEIYDPDSNAWTFGPMLNTARTDHAMVLLGSVPHVIGGRNGSGLLASSEKMLLDQMGTPYWQTATGSMVTARARPTATAFENGGRIFVAGGLGLNESPQKTVEFYDSAVGWATPVAPAPILTTLMARAGHAMVSVPPHFNPPAGAMFGFSVLLIGGKTDGGTVTPKSERCWALVPAMPGGMPIFECSFMAASNVSIPLMKQGRVNHAAVYDPDSKKVHVFGGDGLKTSESYEPMLGTSWTENVTTQMQSARSLFTATAIQPFASKYFVIGGVDTTQNSSVLDTVDVYDAKKEQFTPTTKMNKPRARHSTVLLPDNRPMVIGGASGDVGTAELMSCTSDEDCQIYNGGKSYCSKEGSCLPQKPLGSDCDVTVDCLNKGNCAMCLPGPNGMEGICADGVCCNSTCEGICESCDEPGTEGQCVPRPKGPPRKDRPECIVDMPSADDLKCAGKCDGVTRDSCEFNEGKSCGSVCTDDTDNTAPLNPSTKTELVCTAEGRCVEGQVTTPCGAYACADDKLTCRVECDDVKQCFAGNVCSNKQCIPGQTMCSDADGLKNNVVKSTIPGVEDVRCEPYRCENGACTNVCETAYDCLPTKDDKGVLISYACDANRTCVPVNETISENESSCSTAPAQQSSRFGWLAAIALAGFVAARRNRPRA